MADSIDKPRSVPLTRAEELRPDIREHVSSDVGRGSELGEEREKGGFLKTDVEEVKEVANKHLAAQRAATVPVIRPLPSKRPRATRAGTEMVSFEVPLRLVTPLLGGAAETREIDSVDVVRGPSVRGHLRFWWRAVQGGHLSGGDLYRRERQLWGGAGDEKGGRSTVEVRVSVLAEAVGEVDASDVSPYGQGAYALWPARATRGLNPQPAAHRRRPGTRFVLGVTCKPEDEPDVRAAVRAWILFGGYGGRTRRGAGSLTVEGPDEVRRLWLPGDATREALRELFGRDVLQPISGRSRDDVPLLAGAGLRVGGASAATADAAAAWTRALHWLRDFRQGQPDSGTPNRHLASHARDRGDSRRPGRSNWPEADKVRQLSPLSGTGAQWAHEPLHNDVPVWPRAGFGLPIVAQFQRMHRERRERYPWPGEPSDFELRWRGKGPDGRVKVYDRLASPLIVKALPLADGRFVPCALWLYRSYPKDGEVILDPKDKDDRSARSAAPFDVLVAPGDQARYTPLNRPASEPAGTRLRNAFFDWLARTNPSLRTVAQ